MTIPSPLVLVHDTYSTHSNESQYTLATIHGANTPLLAPGTPSYGTATFPRSAGVHGVSSSRRVILNAALKMAGIFLVSAAVLGGTLWIALPTLEEEDRPLLTIPRSFAQLQTLNVLLKKYRDIYPYKIVICYVITYLFLQAFSLPGSMYLSILGGAVWGVPKALPLACCCVATGASLCYLISAALGPALLTLPSINSRLTTWSTKIASQRDNIISFLIVMRIAPLPPHWVVNLLCPHLGIGLVPFWISTALGVLGVSVIHTTIGNGLDDMTSADDFHLISWKNFFGLAAVVVGVLIPVGLRYYFQAEVAEVAEVQLPDGSATGSLLGEHDRVSSDGGERGDRLLAVGPRAANKWKRVDGEDSDEYDEDEDADLILEAGPAMAPKDGQNPKASSSSEDIISL